MSTTAEASGKGRTTGIVSAAVETYRYLRLAMLSMIIFLGVSLGIEIAARNWQLETSISAYYYTPVRSAFVGTLMAVALALIAIRGRDGWEEDLLNLAGLLAPLVAVVPTPITPRPGEGLTCAPGVEKCIPEIFVPGVENNVKALIALGMLGVAFAIVSKLKSPESSATWIGIGVAALIVAGFGAWFVIDPPSFRSMAHYFSAVPLFAMLAGVAVVNAQRVRVQKSEPLLLTRNAYRRLYIAIAVLMWAIALAAVGYGVVKNQDPTPLASWIFWVEAILLALFAAFWALQTSQKWNEGISTVDEA